MEKKCIGVVRFDGEHGGKKARNDSIAIALQEGFVLVPLSDISFDIRIKDFLPLTEIANFNRIFEIKDSIVFVQHPFPLFDFDVLFSRLCKRNKVIVLSHDLGYVRYGKSGRSKQYCIDLYNKASCIISLNEKYTQVLKGDGVACPIVELGMWDYLIPPEVECQRRVFRKPLSVCFAGNLYKSQFIEEWVKTQRCYSIDIIGPLDTGIMLDSCNYFGEYSSEEVPKKISSHFGLVWDGFSIDDCSTGGGMGKYLRINNPHKLSLYIAAGVPVFVWKQAAIAEIVRKYDIGFCIDSLLEIDSILQKITSNVYERLLNNVLLLQKKVTGGFFLRTALNKALEMVGGLGE